MPGKLYAFETKAKYAYLHDLSSGAVLLDKNSNQRIAPASMTKMMTIYLLFDHLKRGKLSLDDAFRVSEKAWRKGGSKMFVELNSLIQVEDLIRGIVVQSGNDACIVVAEGLAGSEARFAKMMSKKAREIGMKSTRFKNASGWPDPGHYSTPRDLAVLAEHLISDFPEYYHYFAEEEYVYHDIRQYNRNPLLGLVDGVDGVKTGFTEESGYGVTVSADRGGRRLMLVIGGLPSSKARSTESEKVLEWGYREFDSFKLFDAKQEISKASVWVGVEKYVPLITDRKIALTLPVGMDDQFTIKIRYKGPVPAPIQKGDEIAKLIVSHPKMEKVEFPLFAGKDIKEQGAIGQRWSALVYYIQQNVQLR